MLTALASIKVCLLDSVLVDCPIQLLFMSMQNKSNIGGNIPFPDKGSEFVRGEVKSVEVGQAVLALDLVHSELDLAESVVLILAIMLLLLSNRGIYICISNQDFRCLSPSGDRPERTRRYGP